MLYSVVYRVSTAKVSNIRWLGGATRTRGAADTSDLAYCVDIVKKNDIESYLTGLVLPQRFRAPFFALRAFNVEIASIKDQIPRNTRHAGRIRYQYWRDVLGEVYAENGPIPSSLRNPVGALLAVHAKDSGLSQRWFERSLEARSVKAALRTGFQFARSHF